MNKRWMLSPSPPTPVINTLMQSLGIARPIASLLAQKGIASFEEAKSYFRPALSELHDPFLMKGMDKAITRLLTAISKQENILLYGDYDVDGTTAVALVYRLLRQYYPNIQFYIPDRHEEGYGFSSKAVDWVREAAISLIITLDCGIKDILNIQHAQEIGIDVIVCDHHEPGQELHPAYAVLDPKQKDCPYPFKELSGCGVGFKLLQAFLLRKAMNLDVLYEHLDLVAISIACDLVPLVGENRILAYHGLQQLNTKPSPGIAAMIQVAKLPTPMSISDVVFGIGPRFNAAGRISHAQLTVQLLLADNIVQARPLAHKLEAQNVSRKEIDSIITQEAIQLMETHSDRFPSTTVLFKEDWHKGVIGIVASRCIEHCYRPTIILTAADDKATGSARSVAGYNIYEAITACADLLDRYGGHAFAAGLTLPIENIPAFQARFENIVAKTISPDMLIPIQHVDLWMPIEKLDDKFFNILQQMEPFGNGNMKPVFISEVCVDRLHIIKEQHLKLIIKNLRTGHEIEAIGFGLTKAIAGLQHGKYYLIAYTIEPNNYYGEAGRWQLNVKGIHGV